MRIRVLILLSVVAGLSAGFGGFEVGWSLLDYGPEARWLSELNRRWGGDDEFSPSPPLTWLGGHGGGRAGPLTVGGNGALTLRHLAADSVESHLAGVRAALDLGWPHAPNQYLVLRPGLELGAAGWAQYVHDRASPFTDPSYRRLCVGWTAGVMPAFEVTGRLPRDSGRYVGLFVKAGYFVPLYGPDWYFHSPPEFSLKGFQLQLGCRFGRLPAGRTRG